ncbi:hypothetical protein EBR25_14460, partial [bacterium]|nr:hypothetical protein [bacterium]
MSSKDALWTEWILKYSEDRCLRAGALVRGGNGLLTVALKGSNSPSHDRAQGGILLVSPKFLPLPALWEKMED